MTLPAQKPMVLPVCLDAIPDLLKQRDQWVIWQAIPKPDGRISKVPIDRRNARPTNALDPANWLSFVQVEAAYQSGKADGIGFVLNGEPVASDAAGQPLYLVGVDLDKVNDNLDRAEPLLGPMRGAYIEKSPSGYGLRLFCLSRHKPRSGQGDGGELYVQGRYLTVTGQASRGKVCDCTAGVEAVEQLLWPAKTSATGNVVEFPAHLFDVNHRILGNECIETPENLERVKHALDHIPPDCSYETWRSLVWSVASLGWSCGPKLVEDWSSGSAAHWQHDNGDEVRRSIASLFDQYSPERGVRLGTLFHHAYDSGMPRPERHDGPLFAGPPPIKPAIATSSQILSRDDLDTLPPMRFIIPSVLPESGIASIYGEPGSGKSFVAIDLAAAISSGELEWFGRPVTQCDVVYVALEGGRGIKQRCDARDLVKGSRAANLKFVLSGLSLLDEASVDTFSADVVSACEPGAVVIIDTLAQATAGADENLAKDMGIVLKAAQAISAATSGLVIFVHHSGKDAARGMRGHSALNGAMDAVIAVERDRQTNLRSWRVTKMKDADDGARGQFELEVVNLGTDKFGTPISSCAVKALTTAFQASNGKPVLPVGKHQKAVLDALRCHAGVDKGWAKNDFEALAKEALSDVSSRHRATRVKAAIDGLIDGGLIKNEGGHFFLTLPSPDHLTPSPHKGGRGGAVV